MPQLTGVYRVRVRANPGTAGAYELTAAIGTQTDTTAPRVVAVTADGLAPAGANANALTAHAR